MEIILNGDARTCPDRATVADVVRLLDRPAESVAVEHNGVILSRSRYAETVLSPGDRLEVVHFVQGG